jgi:curved DNA-binding protein CbpA
VTDPFDLLGVESSADDETIKKAYLTKVRDFPPDHAPEEFQAIRSAYEAIKTKKARVAYELFHHPSADIASLWRDLVGDPPPQRPDSTLFKQMLAETMKQYRLPADRLR